MAIALLIFGKGHGSLVSSEAVYNYLVVGCQLMAKNVLINCLWVTCPGTV